MVLIAMPREASGHEPKDAAGSFALVCEDEMRASDQIASLNEELRIARAALDRAEAEKADLRNENFDLRRYFDVNEYVWKERDAIRAELAAAKQYGIDCLSAACATHQIELADAHQKSETETEEFWKCLHERDEKINRLVKELAAVREALDRCNSMSLEAAAEVIFDRLSIRPMERCFDVARAVLEAAQRNARTALQSHQLEPQFKPCVIHHEELHLTEMILEDTLIVWRPWGPYKGHAVDCGYAEDGRLVGIKIWDDVHNQDALQSHRRTET